MTPINAPSNTSMGISMKEDIATVGTSNGVSDPNTTCVNTAATTEARITDMKPAIVYSMTMTSIENMTPATGVLKEAEIAAAVPHPSKTLTLLLGNLRYYSIRLLPAEPRWMAGPSRPSD